MNHKVAIYPLKMFQLLCKYIGQCSEPHPNNTVDKKKRKFTINYQTKPQMTTFPLLVTKPTMPRKVQKKNSKWE